MHQDSPYSRVKGLRKSKGNWTAASDNVTAAAGLEYLLCSGASAAAIDTVTKCETATVEMTWSANTLTKAITGKIPSTTYHYRVIVRDAASLKDGYVF